MTHTPNPGSPAAIAQGCVCPRVDNRNGTGSGPFWVNGDCPLHGTTLTFGSTMPAPQYPDREDLADAWPIVESPSVVDFYLEVLAQIAEQFPQCEACGADLSRVALREIRRGERPNRLRHEVCP